MVLCGHELLVISSRPWRRPSPSPPDGGRGALPRPNGLACVGVGNGQPPSGSGSVTPIPIHPASSGSVTPIPIHPASHTLRVHHRAARQWPSPVYTSSHTMRISSLHTMQVTQTGDSRGRSLDRLKSSAAWSSSYCLATVG